MQHAVVAIVKSRGPTPATVPGSTPQRGGHAANHGGYQRGVLVWPPPGRPGLCPRRNRGKFKFKFTRVLRPYGCAPVGRPGLPSHLDLTTVGPLDARLYRHWICQGKGVMSGLEERSGGEGKQRGGGGPGGDSNSPGGGRGLRLSVRRPPPP